MQLTRARQTMVLIALTVILVLLIGYRITTDQKPRTAPLTYQRGVVASSPVRQGLISRRSGADPLNIFLERRRGKYPGVARDIFHMENPAPRPKPVVSKATATPPVHIKTPEELATEAALAVAEAIRVAGEAAMDDMNKFKFLGYLTDKEDSLFLSREGELFIVKRGDTILKSYTVSDAGKNFVALFDTVTGVGVRLELSGADTATQTPQHQTPQQVTPNPRQQGPQPQLPIPNWQQQRQPVPQPKP